MTTDDAAQPTPPDEDRLYPAPCPECRVTAAHDEGCVVLDSARPTQKQVLDALHVIHHRHARLAYPVSACSTCRAQADAVLALYGQELPI